MAPSENQTFPFTWQIENFSMCPEQTHDYIASPSFVVDFLENTEWRIELYPRGREDPNKVGVYLRRIDVGKYAQEITVMYGLSALSTRVDMDIEKEMTGDTFKLCSIKGYGKFCTREKIFESESGLLPNDTLTLRCQLSRHIDKQKDESAVLQDLNTHCWNSTPLSKKKYEWSARTRVRVSSTSFVWPIKRIAELPCDVKLSMSTSTVVKSKFSFDLSLYLKEDVEGAKSVRIEIRRQDHRDDDYIFVRCQIRRLRDPKNVQGVGEHYFKLGEQNEVWLFPTFFKLDDLTPQNHSNSTDGTLYLQCDFSFTNGVDTLDTVSIFETCPLHITERGASCALIKNFENLYLDGEFVDTTLRVQEREFKVHRLVLIAASEVFRRMFGSRMREEQSGVVDIDDLDPNTVERLLKYMYTHELEEMNPEDASKLYSAADKYNIEGLKCQLRSHLISSLSVNTVCGTLILADAHHDEELSACVVDYIHRNSSVIFHSSNWQDFTVTRSAIAATTMLQILKRK